MESQIAIGLLIPFLGTALGSSCVFLLKKEINFRVQKFLNGFAAGVMVAASVWSLLIPAIEQTGKPFEAAIGFWIGILFLLLLDNVVPHLHNGSNTPEGKKSSLSNSAMLLLAVTIHNIPEGMAVGVVFAAILAEGSVISLSAAFALSLGIAIQNFPEGAIISMPLKSSGLSRRKAFIGGALSGAVEPAAGLLTILLSSHLVPLMPYCLSFAAGAMLYVVIEELIPELSEGAHSNVGAIAFAFGFSLMMVLDILLG